MCDRDIKKLAEKELLRSTFAFKEIKILRGGEDLYTLAKSYFDDAKHFYDNEEYFEAFELFNYLWGLLDAGARLGIFNPGKARKHYKIDQ